MINLSKLNKQHEGIEIWKNNNFQGTLNYVPRFGKTKIIEIVVDRTFENLRNKNLKETIVLLVPTEIAYNNVKYIKDKHDILLYTWLQFKNLIANGNNQNGFLLIIDEIHKFINSEENVNILASLNFKYHLGLTGSILTSIQKLNLKALKFPVIDVITEEEAIRNNWLADYDEYNIPLELTENEKKRFKTTTDIILEISNNFRDIYKTVNSKFKKIIFKSDYELLQSCYIGIQTYNNGVRGEFIKAETMRLIVAALKGYVKDKQFDNDLDKRKQLYWNPDNIHTLAKNYIKNINTRNNYLKHNINKVNAVLKILNFIQAPTIVYNESIEMIDQLYDSLNPKVAVKYHSAIESTYMYYDNGEVIRYLSGEKKGQPKLFGKTTIKKQAIERIKSGQALYLITGRSLNESLDLPNIRYIICTAGDSNPSTYDQRVSRGKTINPDDLNKKCVIINLYIDNFYMDNEFVISRDKEKLMLRQNNVKNTIWLENIDDLFVLLKK